MKMSKIYLVAIFGLAAVATCVAQNSDEPQLHVLQVQPNVYMLVSAEGNFTVQTGSEGALLVDTGTASLNAKITAELKKLSDQPLRYVIDTDMHPNHTGGNAAFAKFGSALGGAGFGGGRGNAVVIAHEKVLSRMSDPPRAGEAAINSDDFPADAFSGRQKDLYFNGEAVIIYHEPNAHTDGDSIVYFRRSDVIAAGDVFVTTSYPDIDIAHGGTIQGEIEALNDIIELAVPADKEEGGTMIIPGRGRLCDEFDVVDYRDMVTIVYERIQDLVKKGNTLEQVKAARPTRDYDQRYGQNGATDRFVTAIYTNLTAKKP
jgi:glyoxylase-like metal-dependent hydrolase (beta-lactamase superfamily II)